MTREENIGESNHGCPLNTERSSRELCRKALMMFSGLAVIYATGAWLLSIAAGRSPYHGEPNLTSQTVAHYAYQVSEVLYIAALVLAIVGGLLRLACRVSGSSRDRLGRR